MKFRGSFAGTYVDGFESHLLMTLRGPVIFEALFSGTVDFTDEQWEAIGSNYQTPDGGPVNMTMLCATRAVLFLRRAQRMRQQRVPDHSLLYDVMAGYQTIQQCRGQLSTRLTELQQSFTKGELDYATFFQMHFAFIRVYALVLCIVFIIGAMMSTLNPAYPEVEKDMHDYIVETLSLAERFQPYRPLGAGIIPITLGAAWTVVSDRLQQEQLENSIQDYMRDYGETVTDDVWIDSLRSLKRRLTLRD